MSAEDYYSGGRTEFNREFENQMTSGVYIVRREEITVKSAKKAMGSANVALGERQHEYGDENKVSFVVRKLRESDGQPLRKQQQKFTDYGIAVIDARVAPPSASTTTEPSGARSPLAESRASTRGSPPARAGGVDSPGRQPHRSHMAKRFIQLI